MVEDPLFLFQTVGSWYTCFVIMQSPLRIYPNPQPLRFLLRKPLFDLSCPFSLQNRSSIRHKNASFTTFSLSSGLKLCGSVSQQYHDEEEKEQEEGNLPIFETGLPIVVKKNGKLSRYFWDGNRLDLTSVDDDTTSFCLDFDDGLRNLRRVCGCVVKEFFIPKHVHGNYVEYVKWKFFHRVFSSALQVLATQAMFRAIGVGYARSFPSAAALNWVLKDGLGRLSRCIYTATVGSAFDTNLKRVRLGTSVLFNLGIGLELLTPVFPHCFLLLASVANIAKQISLACHLATYPAVHRSFAIVDNLGEVSAKAQIQTVCFDNLGLLLAALLNLLCKNNHRLQAGLPFFVFPFFSAMDLLGIYQGLKHVHLKTLTKDRLEIIINTWIQFNCVPSPAEVSKQEDINLFGNIGKELWPIRIGCVDVKKQLPLLTFLTMKTLTSKDFYFISLETLLGLTRRPGKGILVCLREGAGTMEAVTGILQACHIREALYRKRTKWENLVEAGEASNALTAEWFKMTQESQRRAQGELYSLYEQMKQRGWIVDNILLSTREQVRYTFDDRDG